MTLDEEEEQEVATSISVFKSGTGRDRTSSTRESSCDHPTSARYKDSSTRRVEETSDLIDRIIASHEKLRADMSDQIALFTETMSEQLSTQTAVLSATLAENIARQTAQLNATLGQHLSRLDKVLTSQGDGFVALLEHLKESRKEISRSRGSSIASERPRGRSPPARAAVEQEKVRSERALGKQRVVVSNEPLLPGTSMDEQRTEENVRYARDDQIDEDLLKLVGPTDLDALIVLRCNETMRRALNGEAKFQSQRQGLGESPSTYRARIDRYAKLSLLIDLSSGTPASTLFDSLNPYRKEARFEVVTDQGVNESASQR
jgi:hypothetical protein